MQLKKVWKAIAVCLVIASCFCAMGAAGPYGCKILSLEELAYDTVDISAGEGLGVGRAIGDVNTTIPANSAVSLGVVPLDKDEVVTFNCTYAPSSANVDFGLVDSTGTFNYLSSTNGRFNRGIRVSQAGNYTLAIRNNSSNAVTVTGTVRY